MLGGGGGGPMELRLHPRTATNAASKAAKSAHLAAIRAVQSTGPARTRSQYFSRNRQGLAAAGASRRRLGGHFGIRVEPESEEGEENLVDDAASALVAAEGASPAGGRISRSRGSRRSSDDTTSSSSHTSVTSSGMSSAYTTDDDSSEYTTDDGSENEEDEEEMHGQGPGSTRGGHATASAAAREPSRTGLLDTSPTERPPVPLPRLSALAAAMEAVSAARLRLRQGSHISDATLTDAAAGSFGAAPGLGLGHAAAADGPRLPPVVQRGKPSTDSTSSTTATTVTTTAALSGSGKQPEASGLRHLVTSLPSAAPHPLAPQPSKRAILPLAGPSSRTLSGAGRAPSPQPVPAGGENSDSLTDWVAQRLRTCSRMALTVDGAPSPFVPKLLPGSGGSSGVHGGLRALLAARSDGAGSWYGRPTRWHDPLSVQGASHVSLLDLRPLASAVSAIR